MLELSGKGKAGVLGARFDADLHLYLSENEDGSGGVYLCFSLPDPAAGLTGMLSPESDTEAEQAPEATWVRSYDDWKADGVTVLKGETGIKTLGSYRFQKENGTLGMGSKVVKMFDVKQTVIKDFDIVSLNYSKAPDAIMATFPAAVEVPELPDGAYALYDHNDKLIRVKEGLDPATKIFVVAREHAVEIMTGNDYNTREAVIRQAEMSAYILTKHYGFDAPEIDFGRISSEYPGKEEKDVRAQLGIIKHVADSIDLRVQEVLELGRETKNRDDREER